MCFPVLTLCNRNISRQQVTRCQPQYECPKRFPLSKKPKSDAGDKGQQCKVCGGALESESAERQERHLPLAQEQGSLASSVFPSSNICEACSSPLKYKKFKFSIKKKVSAFFLPCPNYREEGVLPAPPQKIQRLIFTTTKIVREREEHIINRN